MAEQNARWRMKTIEFYQDKVDNKAEVIPKLTPYKIKETMPYSKFKEYIKKEFFEDSYVGIFLRKAYDEHAYRNVLIYNLISYLLDLKKEEITYDEFCLGINNIARFLGEESWKSLVESFDDRHFVDEDKSRFHPHELIELNNETDIDKRNREAFTDSPVEKRARIPRPNLLSRPRAPRESTSSSESNDSLEWLMTLGQKKKRQDGVARKVSDEDGITRKVSHDEDNSSKHQEKLKQPPEPNDEPILEIGSKVNRLFSMDDGSQKWFQGVIKHYDKEYQLYQIEYDDGDEEVVTEIELKEIIEDARLFDEAEKKEDSCDDVEENPPEAAGADVNQAADVDDDASTGDISKGDEIPRAVFEESITDGARDENPPEATGGNPPEATGRRTRSNPVFPLYDQIGTIVRKYFPDEDKYREGEIIRHDYQKESYIIMYQDDTLEEYDCAEMNEYYKDLRTYSDGAPTRASIEATKTEDDLDDNHPLEINSNDDEDASEAEEKLDDYHQLELNSNDDEDASKAEEELDDNHPLEINSNNDEGASEELSVIGSQSARDMLADLFEASKVPLPGGSPDQDHDDAAADAILPAPASSTGRNTEDDNAQDDEAIFGVIEMSSDLYCRIGFRCLLDEQKPLPPQWESRVEELVCRLLSSTTKEMKSPAQAIQFLLRVEELVARLSSEIIDSSANSAASKISKEKTDIIADLRSELDQAQPVVSELATESETRLAATVNQASAVASKKKESSATVNQAHLASNKKDSPSTVRPSVASNKKKCPSTVNLAPPVASKKSSATVKASKKSSATVNKAPSVASKKSSATVNQDHLASKKKDSPSTVNQASSVASKKSSATVNQASSVASKKSSATVKASKKSSATVNQAPSVASKKSSATVNQASSVTSKKSSATVKASKKSSATVNQAPPVASKRKKRPPLPKNVKDQLGKVGVLIGHDEKYAPSIGTLKYQAIITEYRRRYSFFREARKQKKVITEAFKELRDRDFNFFKRVEGSETMIEPIDKKQLREEVARALRDDTV